MKAVGYIRISTDEQVREGVSLKNQAQKIRFFCEPRDWELAKIFFDEGKSGNDLNREGIRHLIAEAEAHKFDAVVVCKVDRLSRRQCDLWHLLDDVFEPNGIGVVSVNEPFDTTSAVGKACLSMIGVFAKLERGLIAERTKDALRHKKEIGDPLGTPPLGFAIVDHERKEVESELATVRHAFKLRREGYGFSKIADTLDGEGYSTKRGGQWHKSTVRYLLNNTLYDGI